MNILHFVVSYWDCILVVIGFLSGLIIAIKKGETQMINAFLFSLVTEAERQFGTGTGALKKAAVIEWIYDSLPSFVKLLFSERNLSDLIEQALASAKIKWASNSNLQEYINTEIVYEMS